MSDPARRLQGRIALVTGGSRGIGRAIARRCALEGAAVAVAARSLEDCRAVATEIEQAGGHAHAVALDLRTPSSVDQAIGEIEHTLGPIDLLVANSGIAGPTAPAWEITLDQWEDTFRVNVTGTFLTCRAVLSSMAQHRAGAIVVVGSMTGKRPLRHRSAYAASKMALVGLVRTLATDAGEHGIRVNLVSPGPVSGPRFDDVVEELARARGVTTDDIRNEFAAGSPMGTLVTPEGVADTVAFLLSDDARHITGEDMNVSSGIVTY